jgi:VanZ family protein
VVSESSSVDIPWQQRLRMPAVAIVVCYWVVLVVATHWPSTPSAVSHNDKWIHLGAYAVLALLLGACWSLFRPLGWRQLVAVLAVVALLGALDEITQIPFGRTGDVYDWMADLLGAALAMALSAVVMTLLARRRDVAESDA